MAIGLHGDKTMYTNANVRPANDVLWSATGPTRALTEGNEASETAYRRPHAPRSAMPKNSALTGLHFDISSTSELSSATNRSRVSDCARTSIRLLDRIQASYRRGIGRSPADKVSQIRCPICSRRRTTHSSQPVPGLSVDSYRSSQLVAYCGPNATQLRSEAPVDCAQPKSISGPIPRPVHRVAFTTLQLAPTMTHVPKQLTGSANDCSAHQISRNKS